MPIEIFPWGPHIVDFRNISDNPFTTQEPVMKDIAAAVEKVKDNSVIFVGNPHYGDYAKWNLAFKKAGFTLIGDRCAINQVYGTGYKWKGKKYREGREAASPDGYDHWIHSFYLVKGEPEKLAFDFSNHKRGDDGDDYSAFWQINYRIIKPYGKGEEYPARYEAHYARLSRNCGVAMGMGLPKCGPEITKCYMTIMALPDAENFSKEWKVFLKLGGLHFAHNLCDLEIAQLCPHNLR